MEKVKVVKAVPGLLNVGDVLISPSTGSDFTLEEKSFNSSRYVSLDYTTVSENIPAFFTFDFSDFENECIDCEACTCTGEGSFVIRPYTEIEDRCTFFQQELDKARPNSEQAVVYQNLIWFIDWLYGDKELV